MDFDVCILGGGPVGGALACRLAQAGLRAAVIDRASLPPMEHPDFDGRAYAIAAGSRPLLEQAGLWNRLKLPCCPIEQIRVSDGALGRPASPLFLHFDQQDLAGTPLGYMVEARSLRVALNAALAGTPGIALHAPATATIARTPDGITATLSSGETLTARLAIAAEGRASPARAQAGITATVWRYRQAALVAAIAHERPHNNTALEHFLPNGPFAQLPMAGNEAGEHLSAIVWSDDAARAPRYLALDNDRFASEIALRLGSHLGRIRAVGRRWLYPLSAMYVHNLTATRLAVVGDAAHGIHPIAGQGLNLGLRDAIALADLLIEAHATGADLGSSERLRAYERGRRADIVSMLAATDALDRLFSTGNPIIRTARDLGIGAVHRMPALKRAFMRQATGQGRAL